MRYPRAGRLVVAAVAAALALGLAPADPAAADTGNALDIGPFLVLAPPTSYPSRFRGYYTRPDATNWGWAEQVLPVGLADGRGQNVGSAAIAGSCFPAAGEEPKDVAVAVNPALLEGACKLHPGSVTFTVGTAHRGKNRDGDVYSTYDRRYFIRYSRTADCKSPLVAGDGAEVDADMRDYGLRMDVVRSLAAGDTQITRQIPVDRVGQYLCIVQGHIGQQMQESAVPIVGIDTVYAWRVRGPWTVYRIVAANSTDRPTGVTAAAGNAEALVRWTYPDAQLAATKFTATSTPDGKTCSIVGAKACLVTGLRNGTAYTFTVSAERNGLRQISDASAAATPRDPNAGGAVGALAAARPIVLPVTGNAVQPLGVVEVTAGLSGAPAAGQQITARSVLACFVAARGGACGNERRVLDLRPTIELQRVRVWIPNSAAGKFLRISQSATTSNGVLASAVVYSAISRDAAVGPNRVDPPAGADPNANAPQPAGDAAAAPADAAAGGAPAAPAPAADAGAAGAAPAADAASGQAPAAAAAGADATQAARAAGVDVAAHPIVASNSPKMQLAASQKVNRGRFIRMKAIVSPKSTGGRIRISLVRLNSKGKYVATRAIYAPVTKGVATKRWQISRSSVPGAFTLVASYEPKGGGKGATTTAPVTIG